MPTLTEEKKNEMLNKQDYVLPEATAETLGGVHQAVNIAESSATSVAGLKETVNDLLYALKQAGVMAADEEEEELPK